MTNLECRLPKMETSGVRSGMRNEVSLLVAASRCTLQTQGDWALCDEQHPASLSGPQPAGVWVSALHGRQAGRQMIT